MYFVSFLLHTSNETSERCALSRYQQLRRLPKSKAFQGKLILAFTERKTQQIVINLVKLPLPQISKFHDTQVLFAKQIPKKKKKPTTTNKTKSITFFCSTCKNTCLCAQKESIKSVNPQLYVENLARDGLQQKNADMMISIMQTHKSNENHSTIAHVILLGSHFN